MALAYLIDENIRRLWKAIQHHNRHGVDLLDAICVGDPLDLPLGSDDPTILAWSERHQRILVSRDSRTLGLHLHDHWKAGSHSAGVFIVRDSTKFKRIIEFMVIASLASEPDEWRDRVEYIS